MTNMIKAMKLLKDRAKANAVTVDDGKQYTKVQDRIEVFREVWGDELGINTQILSSPPYHKGDIFIMRASITRSYAPTTMTLATGHAMEIIASDSFTSTAFVEVAETSAIGRALAAFGLHGGEYASAEEIQNVPNKQRALNESQQSEQEVIETAFIKANETDITTRKITLDDYHEKLSFGDANFVCKTLVAAGSLAKNMGELSAYWSNNEKVIDLLKESDMDMHTRVVDFFKQTQAKLKERENE